MSITDLFVSITRIEIQGLIMVEHTEGIIVSVNEIADLAIEFWRLRQWMITIGHEKQMAPLRHYYREMEQFLAACHVEIIDLVGREYDAGMAVDIIDSISATAGMGQTMIVETVSPLVIRNGQVIRYGKIITQGSFTDEDCEENTEEGTNQ